jgi:hypothetical protein
MEDRPPPTEDSLEPLDDLDLFADEETKVQAEDEGFPAPPVPEPRRRERRPQRQQIVLRRLIAVGVGLLLVLLLGLGLKACFNARNKAALKDYVSRDVSSIISDSQQTSDQFFKTLNDPKGLTALDYQNEVKAARGAADALVTRAEKLDEPGDMKNAHDALLTTLELRRDGLQTVADNAATALAREGRAKAIASIASAMKSFLASDVVYTRISAPQMKAVLEDHDITDVNVPQSQFLPTAPDWLDPVTVTTALGKVSGSSAAATPGSHGMGLIGTTIGGTTLQPDTPATVSGGATPELDVQVQNQGSVEETDVAVSVTISGGGPSTLEGSIPRIGAGETQTVKIPITPAPPTGQQVTIAVEVQPVAGETVQTNNKATYQVTFSG